jgi:excisionase family DNA binding protein
VKTNDEVSEGREKPGAPSTRTAFSVQEVAEQLGICQASVYRALRRGDIEGVMLGGRRLIPVRSIEKLLGDAA